MIYGGVLILFIIIGILIILISIIIMQNYNRKKVKMSFKESMNLTELPVVTFYNGTNKLNFLLDTGSNLCVINSNSLKPLTYTKLNETGHIHGMEGSIIDVEYISMNFTHNEKLYTSKCTDSIFCLFSICRAVKKLYSNLLQVFLVLSVLYKYNLSIR